MRTQRPPRLASIVLQELAHRVIAGSYAPGDVLPTEPALGEEFGVSRTVVREGLKMLEERGLVRVEQGRGTTVQPRDSWNLLDPVVIETALTYDDEMKLLDDLMAVRRVLEREMARAAAGRLTADDLAALDGAIGDMERSYEDYDRFRDGDTSFHGVILRASGNDVGLAIVRTIHEHADVRPALATVPPRAALARTVTEHRAIYEALAAGDGALAAERTAAHIDFGWADRKRQPAT